MRIADGAGSVHHDRSVREIGHVLRENRRIRTGGLNGRLKRGRPFREAVIDSCRDSKRDGCRSGLGGAQDH